MALENANEILDLAIEREQDAHDFYMGLASKSDSKAMTKTFEQFAAEEAGHKKKLERVKAGKKLLTAGAKVADLKIAEYTVDVDPDEELDYQAALIVAMKREKAAFRLYSDLAASTDDGELQAVFLELAQEEAKHKLRFEVEYDDVILTEN